MYSKIRSTKNAACFLAFAVLLFSPGLLVTAHAQVAGATLSGTVTDQSGGVLPQAAISIKNIATGITRSSTTSTAGFYSVPNLLPGTYEIRAAAQGFSSVVQTGITLTVGEQQVLNFTLQVGQITQTVEVTTEAPNVQLASSSISAVINSTTVRELPLNGRSWTDLATLQPGVNSTFQIQTDFAVGGDRGNRGFGNQITVAGARPEQNNFRLDGVSINDFNNAAPGSVLGGDMGVDAVQEFSVLTSNVSAETTTWTPQISLRMPTVSRKVLSGKISSGSPRAVPSGRTNCLSSAITKGCAVRRAFPTLLVFLRLRHEATQMQAGSRRR